MSDFIDYTDDVAEEQEDVRASRRRRSSDDLQPQSPLETYLREINETPLLSAKEERDLARQIVEGHVRARDHMLRGNLPLVVNIARGYVGKGLGYTLVGFEPKRSVTTEGDPVVVRPFLGDIGRFRAVLAVSRHGDRAAPVDLFRAACRSHRPA